VTECYQGVLDFGRCQRRVVEADFSGGDISSDGGVLLLREVDRRIGLMPAMARALGDSRRQASCDHRLVSLLRQRVFALALGYEDVNDHDHLRHDGALQTACGRVESLGSSSTVGRVERRADRQAAWALHRVLVEQFIASFAKAPEELVLDFDATDDPVHGQQEGRFFHGYYDHYCFLPLYVTCGDQLLVSYLRPANIDAARHAWAILALLVKRLRQVWPTVRITYRGDSGFCRWRMLRWCEDHDVGYIVGIAKNERLLDKAAPLMRTAKKRFEDSGEYQRHFCQVAYSAASWDRLRQVIVKVEHSAKGENPRFVVTNLDGDPQALYDTLYCARGDMENKIKQQFQLFSDRTSCHGWWANQFRLLLSSCAYVLVDALRRVGLKGTALARAEVHTIRLQLFKIGTAIVRNTRRIRFLLSSSYPRQDLFTRVVANLESG
jgi:Transposase DDE domain group 1